MLNFSYKLYVRKHVPNIIPHNIPHFDKYDMVVDKDVLDIQSKMLEI